MKKLTLAMIVIWSLIGLAILLVLIFASVAWNRGGIPRFQDFGTTDKSTLELAVDETIPIEDISEISVNLAAEECHIYTTDSDAVSVKHYVSNQPNVTHARIVNANGLLSIESKPSYRFSFSLFNISRRSIIEIYLPKEYHDVLGLDMASGSVILNGALDLDRLSIRISSGKINSEYPIKASEVEIGVTSGNIQLTGGLESDSYTIKSASGTIGIDGGLKGSGSVGATSGTVKLFDVDITDRLDVRVTSGSVDVKIAGDPSLKFDGYCTSGTIRTYFDAPNGRSVSATVGEEPYKDLNVHVTSGTVRITQK